MIEDQSSPLRVFVYLTSSPTRSYLELRNVSLPTFNPRDFVTTPSQFNSRIPANIDLVCGDPLLELQANAINTLSNTQIPGAKTWLQVIDWLNDFLVPIDKDYDTIFLDCNPSFSIYTQIGLASVERLVLPVMVDDSSRRAVQNALSLVYGLRLPSPIYATYAFNTKLQAAGRQLPKVHLIVRNKLTQYMGPTCWQSVSLRLLVGSAAGRCARMPWSQSPAGGSPLSSWLAC